MKEMGATMLGVEVNLAGLEGAVKASAPWVLRGSRSLLRSRKPKIERPMDLNHILSSPH